MKPGIFLIDLKANYQKQRFSTLDLWYVPLPLKTIHVGHLLSILQPVENIGMGQPPLVNFINILHAAFTCVDSTSAKRQSSHQSFCTFEIYTQVKAASKHVGEIEHWREWHLLLYKHGL